MATAVKGVMNTLDALNPSRVPVLVQDEPGEQNAPAQPLKADILLVDDREDKLLALEAVLSGLGQNLVKARSGKEALRKLLRQDFALILLDISMPEMDGFETAALIRQRRRSEHTPIIFVTSYNHSENYISRGYSLGAVDYIVSPIVPEILRAKVSVFVELYLKTELIKRQGEQLRQAELKKHRFELAGVSDRLEAETKRNRFFTLAPDVLGIADLEGRLLQANPSWERTLGYTDTELKSFSCWSLVHPDDAVSTVRGLDALRYGNETAYFEARFRHRDGTYRWLGLAGSPFIAEKLIYIFGRDITSRKEGEERIIHLNQELERRVAALTDANRELQAFNYSISHDLRTPLRSMTGFAKALMEEEAGRLSPLGKEYADRIMNSAKYMDVLLRDLLAYSRLARQEIILAPVDLELSARELIKVLEGEILRAKARVEIVSPMGSALAHWPTLQQILGNLVGNSLKFVMADRESHIRLFTTRAEGFVRLWVEDNGIGIRREYHEKIFGLFERLPDARDYPGTGIGLALVRKGAERMGGRAGVESQPGQGSRFWVDLPDLERNQDAEPNPAR
jgi:PAS domain S-box-containing protein